MAQAKKALAKKSRTAARATKRARSKTYHNFIGGRWVPSKSGQWLENRNPADTRDLLGRFPLSISDDVSAAVSAAAAAFDGWRRTPAPRRAEILFRVGEILIRDKEKYTADMTREMGKVLKEAGGDVQEAIDCTYYAAGEGRRLHGFTKPAEDTPLSTYNLVKACEEAGVPPGVVNLVMGQGEIVGARITSHPSLRLISLTGSPETGRVVASACAERNAIWSLEMGGKNAIIVMDDADVDNAIE